MILNIGNVLGMNSPATKVNQFVIRSMFVIRSIQFECVIFLNFIFKNIISF